MSNIELCDGAGVVMGHRGYDQKSKRSVPGQIVDPTSGKVLLAIPPPTAETPVVAEGDVSKVVQQRDIKHSSPSVMAEAVFSPDGKQLAAWGWYNNKVGPRWGRGPTYDYIEPSVTLWDAKTGKPLRQLKVDDRGQESSETAVRPASCLACAQRAIRLRRRRVQQRH